MIKYNDNTIKDWNFGDDNIIKVYKHGAVVFYKFDSEQGGYKVCYAVVDDITQYSETEFEDVYDKATEKWYKLNNLDQYEQYGIYGSGRSVTTYNGKLTIDDGYEYEWNGSSWVNLGEVSGSSRVEYIERNSTHSGYLPLGEYFTENTVIDIDFNMTQAKGNAIIGDYGSNDNNDWRVFLNYDTQVNNWLIYDFINSRKYYNTGDWSKRFNLEIGNYYIKDLNTGTYLVNATRKTSFTRPNQMYLFHMEGSQITNNIDYGYIYSVKIYQNNELVRDFVPWTDGNGNYGLYDNVSSSVTQSIGSMTGHSISVDVYPKYYTEKSEPLDNLTFNTMAEAQTYAEANCVYVGLKATINGDKYVFSGDSQSGYEWVYNPSRLPVGYTEVEYIQNTGHSYIDTNFVPNQDTRIVADMQLITLTDYPRLFGAGGWNAADGINIDYEGGHLLFSWFGNTSWTTTSLATNYDRHIYDLNKNNLYVDETLLVSATYTTRTASDNLAFFTYIRSGRPSDTTNWNKEFFNGKLWSFKVYDNGTLVRDLVPCIKDSDNTVGAYDIVNNVFYTVPTGYTTDKLIAGNPV